MTSSATCLGVHTRSVISRLSVSVCLAMILVMVVRPLPAQLQAVANADSQQYQPLAYANVPVRVPSELPRVTSMAFSPDGKFLLSGHGWWREDVGSIQIWDLATGKRVGKVDFPIGVCHVHWTSDGRHLICSVWNSTVHVIGYPSLAKEAQIKTDRSTTHTAVSPDGSKVLTATEGYSNSDDSLGRVVNIWNAQNGELIRKCGKEANLFRLSCAAWSSSGKYVAAAGGNLEAPLRGEARLWDAATGKEIARLEGHERYINDIHFFRDDTRIATASQDGTIRIWETATGKELEKIPVEVGVLRFAISPDDSQFAVTTYRQDVTLWDIGSGEKLLELPNNRRPTEAVTFSADGKHLAASGADGIINVWNLPDGDPNQELPAEDSGLRPPVPVVIAPAPNGDFVAIATAKGELQAISTAPGPALWSVGSKARQAPTAVAVAPDQSGILVGTADGQLRWHSAKDGSVTKELKRMPAKVTAVLFAAKGERFITGDADGRLWFWDRAKLAPAQEHQEHHAAIMALGASRKQGSTTSISLDGTAITWKTQTGEKITEQLVSSTPLSVATISEDGSTLFVQSSPNSRGTTQPVWDAVKLTPLQIRNGINPQLSAAVLSRDGSHLISVHPTYALVMPLQQNAPPRFIENVSGSGLALIALSADDRVFYQSNFGGGLSIRRIIPVRQPPLGQIARVGNAVAVAVSPDGKWLVAGGDDSQISFWDLTTGELVDVLSAGGGCVFVCAFSPDGRYLATGTLSGSMKVWNVADRSLEGALLNAHPSIRTLAFSPDNRWLASGGSDRVLKVTDTKTWETATTETESSLWVTGLAFSPSGRTLYSVTGSWDGADQPAASELSSWSVKADKSSCSLKKTKTVAAHTNTVDNLVLTKDGKTIVTGSADGNVKVWNAETLASTKSFRAPQGVHRIQLFRDHQTLLAIGGHQGGVAVWNIATGEIVSNYTGHTGHTFDIATLPDGSGLVSAGEDDSLLFWTGPAAGETTPFRQLLKTRTP